MSEPRDFLIHREPNRNNCYRTESSIRWSTDLKRWMVFDPDLISQVLQDERFVVHDYRFDRIMAKYDLHLMHLPRMRDFVPLATEGDEHSILRDRMIQEISANTAAAVEAYDNDLAEALDRCIAKNVGGKTCLAQDVFRPTLRKANIAVAGLEAYSDDIAGIENLDNLPLFFDDTISVRHRSYLDEIAGRLMRILPSKMEEDEKHFRIAMVTLGLDTLSSTILLSLKAVLEREPGVALDRNRWDADLPATGLPIVERKANEAVQISGTTIAANDRVRLFVDAAGFRGSSCPHYSDLYFAAGAHQCVGKAFTRKIWKASVARLRSLQQSLQIRSHSFRSHDAVFNLLDRLEVSVHD